MTGDSRTKRLTHSRCCVAARTKMGDLPRWVGAGIYTEYMNALDVDRPKSPEMGTCF